jgi:hypothetical protein
MDTFLCRAVSGAPPGPAPPPAGPHRARDGPTVPCDAHAVPGSPPVNQDQDRLRRHLPTAGPVTALGPRGPTVLPAPPGPTWTTS